MPVQTYFNANQDGILAMSMTTDSKYISTLSAKLPQTLSIWEWTTESELPVCSIELSADLGLQRLIRFNTDDIFQLISNGDTLTVFFEWSPLNGVKYFAPKINDAVWLFLLMNIL